jgi:predicted alpha/beta-fold hydrolase
MPALRVCCPPPTVSSTPHPFRPPLLLRSRHVQTLLATTGPRRLLRRKTWRALERNAREIVLDAGQGVRLAGLHSGHGDGPRDLVTILHGWEGSARSLYVRSCAGHLFDEGYDVFRLHLRDHGKTHALNREPFTSTRLREAVEALASIHRQLAHRRHCLVGFSLGGNFALRMALHAPAAGVELAKVVAVCPAILPEETMETLESGFFVYHRYFLHKWKRSLRRKLALFPELGYGPALSRCRSLSAMNDYFVPNLTEFTTPHDYFTAYAIADHVLAPLTVSAHVIMAADDPIIDIRHLDRLARPACLSVEVARHGGHCGFVQSYRLDSWIDRRIERLVRA